MGVSNSPAEVARKLFAASEAVRISAKETVEASALLTKQTILAQTPGRLRGVGKKGAKLGVRYNLGEYPDGAKAIVYATGPFKLIENDTKAHRIPRERSGRGRRRVVVIPGVGPRAYANHPGTKGKHPFAKGAAEAATHYDKVAARLVHTNLKAIF